MPICNPNKRIISCVGDGGFMMSGMELMTAVQYKLQLIILKVSSSLASAILISSLITHARTGFITRSFGEKIPNWDNTRELLDWEHIGHIVKGSLKQEELASVATLSWFDSGQLTSAFNYKHFVGVIGPNDNHFKYINLKEKDFTTLIDLQLIHNKQEIDLSEQLLDYNYKILDEIELPFFRGTQKYGIIRVISLEKSPEK